jgi:teichoic acid transport system permease protein
VRPHSNLIEVGRQPSLPEYVRLLWRGRDFLIQIVVSQVRLQTQATILGSLWHLLNPLLQTAIYYIVFGLVLNASRGVNDYAAFLVVGVFVFVFTSRSIESGARSLTTHRSLVSQTAFPRIIIPVAAVLTEAVLHAIALLMLLAMLPLLGVRPMWSWILLPLAFSLQAFFNLGVAMMAARLAFRLPDVQLLLPHALRFWMYASGVFFALEFVSQAFGELTTLLFIVNPAFTFIDLTRAVLLEGSVRETATWLLAFAWPTVALISGALVFRAREDEYGLV